MKRLTIKEIIREILNMEGIDPRVISAEKLTRALLKALREVVDVVEYTGEEHRIVFSGIATLRVVLQEPRVINCSLFKEEIQVPRRVYIRAKTSTSL